MKLLLLTGTSLAALTLQAAAADLPSPAIAELALVEPSDWSGFYAGVNAGYARQHSNGDFDLVIAGVPYTDPLDGLDGADGFIGGVQAGFNRQIDSFVLGIETDIQAAAIGDDVEGFGNGAEISDYSASLDVNWFGTLRGRAGIAFDNTLLYATGGLAVGDIDFEVSTISDAEDRADMQSDGLEVGFALGAGIEHKFADAWSLKLEYQYIDFGDIEADAEIFDSDGIPTGDSSTAEMDLSFHTARIGLNYRF
jgi:outer membrane immunogenic protein